MSRFFVGGATLRDTLDEVAHAARQAVSGADMAGLTMVVDGRPATTVFTDEVAVEIDAAQYETGIGPCLDALRDQTLSRSDQLEQDPQWPPFSEAAVAHGFRSVLSLPVVTGEDAVGALNFYSRCPGAFAGDEAVDVGNQFATQMAIVLARAQGSLSEFQPLTDELASRITSGAAAAARLADRIDPVITSLIRRSTRLLPDDLSRLVEYEATRIGLGATVIFLADLEHRILTPLPSTHVLVAQDIDATVAGRAFQLGRPIVVPNAEHGGFGIWMPLVDGAERLGVMYLESPATSDHLLRRLEDLAGLVAELVVSKSQYGDALKVAARSREMTLAAELRWAMVPPLTFSGDRVGIACVLEPAYEVAGDAFDYAVNDGILHLAVMDAMGHGLEASLMANLVTAAYRMARRRGLDLAATYHAMDEALSGQFGQDRFVTAQLATLDTGSGRMQWVNAGHPRPLLLRQGRVAFELQCEPTLPLGLSGEPTLAEVSLEPTDSLLFFTDGIVEAVSPDGERFGTERLVDFTRRALADRQTLPETARRLVRAVRAHRAGPLADDATVLFVDWHP
jgi:GAF domain-containing protein